MHAHTHVLPQTSTSTCTLYKTSSANLAYKEGLTTEGDSSVKGENIAGLLFWEKEFFRSDLKESREGIFQRGRGRSFHVEELKTGKAWEPMHRHHGIFA